MVAKAFCRLSFVLVLFIASLSANAEYNFTALDLGGGSRSYAFGINNSGQVVGTTDFYSNQSYSSATLWYQGTVTQLNSNGNNSYALDINDSGTIVGFTFTSYTTHYDAAVWQGDNVTYLTSLGSDNRASAINNNGLIIGTTNQGSSTISAIWDGNSINYVNIVANDINDSGQIAGNVDSNAVIVNDSFITTLNSLGGYSKAEKINDNGQIVGYSTLNNGYQRATLWDGNITPVDLGTLFGYNSYAFSINESGQIVGSSTTITGLPHATLWHDGSTIDLNNFLNKSAVDDGWVLNEAYDINESGSIVGSASNSRLSIYNQAFVLTSVAAPVPEADTSAMLLTGLGVMGFIVRRRKNTQA